MEKSIEKLKSKIELLKGISKTYELNQNSWEWEKLIEFENKYEIELPVSYKIFLSQFGEGNFDVLPLKRKPEEDFYVENKFENLKKPFLYVEEWNENNKKEFIEKYKYSNRFIQDYVDLESIKRDYKRRTSLEERKQLKLFDYNGFYESEIFIDEIYIMYYYSENHINGCLYLFDYGCNIRGILIVNGKRKGAIWIDDRANGNGIFPTNTTFNKWLNNLLDKEILEFEKKEASS